MDHHVLPPQVHVLPPAHLASMHPRVEARRQLVHVQLGRHGHLLSTNRRRQRHWGDPNGTVAHGAVDPEVTLVALAPVAQALAARATPIEAVGPPAQHHEHLALRADPAWIAHARLAPVAGPARRHAWRIHAVARALRDALCLRGLERLLPVLVIRRQPAHVDLMIHPSLGRFILRVHDIALAPPHQPESLATHQALAARRRAATHCLDEARRGRECLEADGRAARGEERLVARVATDERRAVAPAKLRIAHAAVGLAVRRARAPWP